MRNILIFGPPNGGKGTLARLIAARYKIGLISTGDVCRAEEEKNSDLYRKARRHMDETGSTLWPTDALTRAFEHPYFEIAKLGSTIIDGLVREREQIQPLIALTQSHSEGNPLTVIRVNTEDDECIRRAELRNRPDDKHIRIRLQDYHSVSVPAYHELMACSNVITLNSIDYDGQSTERERNRFVEGLGMVYNFYPYVTEFASVT